MTSDEKRAYYRQWYSQNKAHCRAAKNSYNRSHRQRVAKQALGLRNNNLIVYRKREASYNWKAFGLLNDQHTIFTRLDYDRLYQVQQGLCAICQRHQSTFSRALCVDHNHQTKKVRGLLCIDCNRKLAILEDLKYSHNAKNYLSKDI